MKKNLLSDYEGILYIKKPTKEERAYTRYADDLGVDDKARELFRFPRDQPYRRINNAELFRV